MPIYKKEKIVCLLRMMLFWDVWYSWLRNKDIWWLLGKNVKNHTSIKPLFLTRVSLFETWLLILVYRSIRSNIWHRRRTWWRHQMETFSALLAICAQRPVTRSFDIFFDVRVWVNTREAGHLRRYRIHYDVIVMNILWMVPFKSL